MRQGLIALVVVLTACASAAPPPGGPEDKEPPKLVKVSPDTNAVNFHDKVASFQFDETINDRGEGPADIRAFFILSPSDGEPHISWHRSRIDIAPRHGFREGLAYTVTLLPGLMDLHNNRMKTGTKVVFSTAAAIPPYNIEGIVFDWAAERPAPAAFVEAFTPDSIRYLAQADSAGKFSIGPLRQGTYLVRGIIDANSNRALDRNEMFDSVRVNAPLARPVELLAAVRDTLPARLSTVERTDSVTLTVVFDRLLDPAQPFEPAAFKLLASDSSEIRTTRVVNPKALRSEQDSLSRLATKLAADSARRADSLAGKKLPPIVPPPAAPPATVGGKPAPPPPPVPSRPAPFTTLVLKVEQPLGYNKEYRLSTRGLKSLAGLSQAGERRFTTPRPPPPPAKKDSSATTPPARRDSTGRAAPPARPPGTPPPE